MISLLQTDLALVLVAPLCLIARRSLLLSSLIALPAAAAQLFPVSDAALGVRGPLDTTCAAVRAACLLGLPWLYAFSLRREREKTAALGGKVWSDLRAVQLGEFLSFVLYQLREYLISVTSLVEALTLSAPKGDEAFSDKLARLKRVVAELNAKAARLLGDRSAVTTQNPREPAPFDLAALARQTLDEARKTFGDSRASLAMTLDGRLDPVTADARTVRACLMAVLQNSLEACMAKPGASSVSIALRQGQDAVRVEVVDDAGGVPPRTLETIFEPFFSARASSHALGLGLPMSRRLMERMGGALRIKSKDGCTAVLLELPLRTGLPVIRNEESTWADRRGQA